MSYNYIDTNWQDYPSTNTPINADALNNINDGIVSLYDNKSEKSETDKLIKEISYDKNTGNFTITKSNGSTTVLETSFEMLPVGFEYDKDLQQLIIKLDDGSKTYIDLKAIVTQYEFVDTNTINVSIDENGKVSFDVIDSSIDIDKLSNSVVAMLNNIQENSTNIGLIKNFVGYRLSSIVTMSLDTEYCFPDLGTESISSRIGINLNDSIYDSTFKISKAIFELLGKIPEVVADEGFTKNQGTVTSISAGIGLTGGTITENGTIRANLVSESKALYESNEISNAENRQYAVVQDKNGKLSVNVPWTEAQGGSIQSDFNVTDTTSAAYIKNKPTDATESKSGYMSAQDKKLFNSMYKYMIYSGSYNIFTSTYQTDTGYNEDNISPGSSGIDSKVCLTIKIQDVKYTVDFDLSSIVWPESSYVSNTLTKMVMFGDNISSDNILRIALIKCAIESKNHEYYLNINALPLIYVRHNMLIDGTDEEKGSILGKATNSSSQYYVPIYLNQIVASGEYYIGEGTLIV